ncbi:YciI family protein [Roseateles sp. BYS180W]|uniref:YciI family protein n=1 Tax=Roseateles rivi TaxID=3299028 RepID=A0ABW7FSP0_9BURK
MAEARDYQALTANQHETWTLFAVRMHDKPNSAALRAQNLAAHLAWVEAHAEQVRAAGSLREDPQATPVGGLWVVRAADKAAVEALIATDPFTTCGLRSHWDIFYWSQAIPGPKSF